MDSPDQISSKEISTTQISTDRTSPDQVLPEPISADRNSPGEIAPTQISPDPHSPDQDPRSPHSANQPLVRTLGADIIGSLQSLLGTIVIAVFVITFIVQAFQIPSQSMENTLLVGDYLLVNKLCYGGRGPGDHLMPYQKIQRGDIVVFHYPVDPTQHFVKRVIGLPGDRLRLINKKVWINGKPLDESYVRYLEPPNNRFRDNFPRLDIPEPGMEGAWWQQMRTLVEDGQLIVPAGHYFVMGDNRDDSQDSRYWGFVPRENIIGRPLVIYWSVRDWDPNPSSSPMSRMFHVAYAFTHIFQITRWNRTLRLVH